MTFSREIVLSKDELHFPDQRFDISYRVNLVIIGSILTKVENYNLKKINNCSLMLNVVMFFLIRSFMSLKYLIYHFIMQVT